MKETRDNSRRREEILDAAEALFAENGYDNTSTTDILNAIGIARGTLYYYFKSKEDILDGVIERIANQQVAKAAAIVEDRSLSIVDRLPLVLLSLNVSGSLSAEVLTQVRKPQNALMHYKMQNRVVNGIVPIITSLLEEGAAAGLFTTERPAEAAEMCVIYANTVFDDAYPQAEGQKTKRIAGFIYNVERLLGTEEGALILPLIRVFSNRG